MENVQSILDTLNTSSLSIDTVKKCLDSQNILIKANAIFAIVRLKLCDDKVVSQLTDIAQKVNEESRVIGVWNNGHFALAALNLINTRSSANRFDDLFNRLATYQQEDINRLISEWPIL